MICEHCNKTHPGKYGSGRFCDSHCARAFSTSKKRKEINEKVSIKLKGNVPATKGKFLIERETRTCPVCNTDFLVKVNSSKIYCSAKCNPAVGGYREGSGRSKSGYYKGIYCGSSYELVWVIYRLDNNLPVNRFKGIISDGKTNYVPDFIIDDTIIEIKGYENPKSVAKKTKLAESKGYKVTVLYKENLKKEFDWVHRHYTFKNVWELYDGYSPSYVYNCSYCKKEFAREGKAKTEVVFCSRKCAGKGHKGKVNSL